MKVKRRHIRSLVTRALKEDRASDDVTVSYLRIRAERIAAALVARESGVIAGLEVARVAFEETVGDVLFKPKVSDGRRVVSGETLAEISGSAAGILSAERVALNFMQRLSGIATLTAQFVAAVKGTAVKILDTRKTTPLMRELEKYAVRVGGGENHRMALDEMVLVKENHLATIGGMTALVEMLDRSAPAAPIEVEVEDLAGVRMLLGQPINRIMLDNFSPEDVRAAVAEVIAFRDGHPAFSPAIEVSGGIDLENIRQYAVPGVNFISIGALTHSAPALDISLEVFGGGS